MFPIRAAAPPALLLILLIAPLAGAHAVFSESDPAPDTQNPVGVTRVTVTLTEDVILDFSDLDVQDLQGNDWTAGVATHGERNNVLTVSTRALADGLYLITWKALSVDTHTTRGQFLVAVGNATLTHRSGSQTEETQAPGGGAQDSIGRAAYYAGLFAALGVPIFFLAIDRARDAPRGALATAGALALLGVGGALVNLLNLAARTETSLAHVAPSRGGVYLTLRGLFLLLAGIALLASIAWRGRLRRVGLALAVVLAMGALLSTSLGSHSASVTESRSITIASDLLHLLMAGVWVGGVLALLFAARGRDASEIARLIARFSPLAISSVLIVLATGTWASVVFVRRLDALWTEPYGRLVLLKIVLLAALVAFGAIHQRVVAPRLLRNASTTNGFRKLLAVEAVVMLAVVGAAGALATTSPPQDEVEIDRTPLVLELDNSTSMSHVILQVSPNPVQVGVQTIHVYLHPLTRDPVPNSTVLQMRLWPQGSEKPEDVITPEKTSLGEWTLRGSHFTTPGTWNVEIIFQRPDEGFRRVNFEVPVEPAGGAT